MYLWCNDTIGSSDGWDLLQKDYFNIYNLGGHSTLEWSGDAGRLEGGDVFDLYAYNNSWAESTIMFRNLQHVKLLPTIYYGSEFGASGIERNVTYSVDYCTTEDDWISGWKLVIQWAHITCDTDHERFRALNIVSYNQGMLIKNQTIYVYDQTAEVDWPIMNWTFRLWIDLWFNKVNASSTVGGRINAYYFPMTDSSNAWLRWLTGSNWGIDEEKIKQSMMFTDLLGSEGEIIHSQQIKLVRIACKVEAKSDSGFVFIQTSDYDIFDLTFGSNPFEGIQTPVFDETKVPVMPQGGFLGALVAWLGKVINKLGEIFGPTILGFWNAFVGFMDTIFTSLGWPNGFSQILSFIGTLISWVTTAVSFVVSLLAIALTYITTLFTYAFQGFTGFIGTLSNVVESISWIWAQVVSDWGWIIDVAVKLLPLFFIFYLFWLLGPLLDRGNWHGTKQRIEDTIGIIVRIVMFMWMIFERLFDLIYRLAEMIPVVE